ncbi:hypothetical protein [Metaclostridioides mangenotii]|uniref:hypothetical protein n=1 Tax=Metaclostridioides mangenotii TaxID=1540 RepID=UPI0026F10E0F|nr:hypothetical protein [Clostridioides mangenotii]
MPNWCEGSLKTRGKLVNIEKFLDETLKVFEFDYKTGTTKELEVKKEKSRYQLVYDANFDSYFYMNGSKRHFLSSPVEIWIDKEDPEEILTVCLGDLRAAWYTKIEYLTILSKKYGIDLKIYVYEQGGEFNLDLEVHNGEIIKNNEISFDDYMWECTNPTIGG